MVYTQYLYLWISSSSLYIKFCTYIYTIHSIAYKTHTHLMFFFSSSHHIMILLTLFYIEGKQSEKKRDVNKKLSLLAKYTSTKRQHVPLPHVKFHCNVHIFNRSIFFFNQSLSYILANGRAFN